MTRQVIQVIRSRPRLDPKLYFLHKTLFIFFENVTLSHLFGVRSKMIFFLLKVAGIILHTSIQKHWNVLPKDGLEKLTRNNVLRFTVVCKNAINLFCI